MTGGQPGDREEDPFDQLLDEEFISAARISEPSAEERAREAARVARQSDLQQRLEQAADHERLTAARDARTEHRARRSINLKRLAGPLVVIALIAGIVWYTTGGGSGDGSSPTGVPDRLVRPTDRPAPDTAASAEPLGAPPAAPDPAGPFEFMRTQPDSDRPVAWDPCRPVRYVINPAGAPEGTEDLLEAAIGRTAAATGLTFTSVGTTDEEWSKERNPYQPDRYGDRWAPALITWSTEGNVPGLAGYVAGMGGGTSVSDSTGKGVYVSGQTVLDAEDLGKLLQQPAGSAAVQAVIQHELGHLLGLDHVADPTQLMYSEGDPSQASDWGSGDLAGLSQLGSGECFSGL